MARPPGIKSLFWISYICFFDGASNPLLRSNIHAAPSPNCRHFDKLAQGNGGIGGGSCGGRSRVGDDRLPADGGCTSFPRPAWLSSRMRRRSPLRTWTQRRPGSARRTLRRKARATGFVGPSSIPSSPPSRRSSARLGAVTHTFRSTSIDPGDRLRFYPYVKDIVVESDVDFVAVTEDEIREARRTTERARRRFSVLFSVDRRRRALQVRRGDYSHYSFAPEPRKWALTARLRPSNLLTSRNDSAPFVRNCPYSVTFGDERG